MQIEPDREPCQMHILITAPPTRHREYVKVPDLIQIYEKKAIDWNERCSSFLILENEPVLHTLSILKAERAFKLSFSLFTKM